MFNFKFDVTGWLPAPNPLSGKARLSDTTDADYSL